MICEWCGHEHERAALCASRPKWSRRGFLALFGAGIAGAALGGATGWKDTLWPMPPTCIGEPGAMFIANEPAYIANRKLMTRIRITPEALAAIINDEGAFARSVREEYRAMAKDVASWKDGNRDL
jgi:hypothetical protein